jgi:uncharacterized cupin superfamily protein
MEHVAIEAVDPSRFRTSRRDLSDPLGTTDVAVVRFDVEPGEAFSGALHAHAAQEEVFVVLDGTATFQLEAGSVTVGANEVVRFAPGEFQRGYNAGEAPVRAIALGAPRVTPAESPITALVDCPTCGERTAHDTVFLDSAIERRCWTCGTTNEPGPPPGLPD